MSPENVPTLTYKGEVFRLPFSHLFRPHTPAEEGEMRRSVSEDGVINPVQVYDSDAYGPNCLISGERRLRYAAEIGVDDVPITRRGGVDDETAHRLALNLNIAARHLTPEEITAARRGKVLELRQEGKSVRGIADELGIHKTQVERDLKAGVHSVDTLPAHVVGADGKEYPATKTPAEPRPPAAIRALAELVHDGGTEAAVGICEAVMGSAADPGAVAEALFAEIEARVERAKLVTLVRGWLARLEGEG